MVDLSDSCVLGIDDNVSSSYAGADMFSNSDSYPTLSHMLSPSDAPSSLSQQSVPTVQRQTTSNCHVAVVTSSQQQPSTISAQPRQNLPLGNSLLGSSSTTRQAKK